MNITADNTACIGAGLCTIAAPDVFDQNPDTGTVIVRTTTVQVDQHEAVLEAEMRCPSQAIKVTATH